MSFIASLVGVTALIFCAKGNYIGQMLMIVFCILYCIISYSYSYYGEMITYIGMSMPMAMISLISWAKNPYKGEKREVTVRKISRKEIYIMIIAACTVTVAFYFILKAFDTANLIPSTLSVTTSFSAAYLTFRRSPYYALIYGLNDIVLIVLWGLASLENIHYISVLVCFIVFLANDTYGFINWKRMQRRQALE